MRKIVVGAFVSLDGVMQAPGGPEEDPTGGFEYGGWLVPFFEDAIGAALDETFSAPFDLLLGRKTYDIFASYWPFVEADPKKPGHNEGDALIARRFNTVTKYVATHRPQTLSWKNSQALGTNAVESLRKLKNEDGPILLTQGSSELIHTLLKHELVDELRLIVFPLVLGRGKRLFDNDSSPSTFRLTRSTITPKGVIIANYERAGKVATGSFA